VLHDNRQFYFFDDIKKIRLNLLQNNSTITVEDFGAGSKKAMVPVRKISSIAKTASIPEKYGQLFSRIVDHFQCTSTIELGTCLGLSTSYLAAANSKAKVVTLEGDKQLVQLAEKNLEQLHLENVEIITGDFSETLPIALNKLTTIDLAFIDGNHSYKSTMDYFYQMVSHVTNNSILIFDDIHWSPGMQQAWKEICNHPKITVTIDLYRLGIVFFRKEQAKENFILYF
jgi:predicted O-methyltransferase YrrM